MRIIRDFKMPNLKFKKIEMNDIPNMEDVKVDYEKVKEAEEKKKKINVVHILQQNIKQ